MMFFAHDTLILKTKKVLLNLRGIQTICVFFTALDEVGEKIYKETIFISYSWLFPIKEISNFGWKNAIFPKAP